jgi:hypothetical protein
VFAIGFAMAHTPTMCGPDLFVLICLFDRSVRLALFSRHRWQLFVREVIDRKGDQKLEREA